MRQIPVRLWLLAVVSGVLQVLAFPIAQQMQGWPVVAWVGIVPLLVALLGVDATGKPLTVRQGAALGYCSGIVWYLGNCWWIYQTMYLYGGLPKPVAAVILVLFAMYLGLYHALFGALLAGLRRLGVGWVLAPFCWVAVELARARVTGFPWDLLGNSQVDNLMLTRLAPVGGVMAISFVVAGVNALLAGSFVLKSGSRWVAGALGAGFVLAITLAGHAGAASTVKATDTAVLLQENLEVGAMGREVAPLTMEQKYSQFSWLSEHPDSLANASSRPALVVWPEAPADFQARDPRFRSVVGGVAQNTGVAVIAGSIGIDMDATSASGYKAYDSATMFLPNGSYAGRYDKIHLVPFGEYVPFKQLLFFAAKLTAGAGNMDPGTRRDVFRTGGHAYGVFICYESIFGDEVREFVQNGAEVLVNISDDGWYGDTGAPWQHLNMERMRAIENHRWVIRDTNTGITTTIDPLGRTTVEAPRHVRGAYMMPFGYESGVTFYTRFGDWFAWVCFLVTLAGIGAMKATEPSRTHS